ncbi:hypothetical protein HHL22_22275 [Hymenobacter sp. RP-2-7]|uniref:STAS/SEC14 domain-containing protein n=1 Tax=Hymenobacter polaris TaxID=2682546 RepID=A0A7Y0FPU3_9BACT|nr:hypothetical protein [Hymenobacter polaris]NML67936.1 hypothetical protein [Hymenobacter polaris]
MNLRHLCSAPHVHVHFDTWNNWLYLEWEGELTLAGVQEACLAVAHCFVSYNYSRVFNNNTSLTHVDYDVAPWLAQHFFPNLGLAGVQQLAWVYGPGLRARELAEYVLRSLDGSVNVALFGDAEDAVSWLQQTRPDYVSGCALLPRAAQQDAKLTHIIGKFEQDVASTRVESAGLLT